MAKHGLKAFDSDMHVYDAADLYDKYMNPKWGRRIPRGQRNGKRIHDRHFDHGLSPYRRPFSSCIR